MPLCLSALILYYKCYFLLRLPVKKYTDSMPALLSPKEDSNEHARQQQQANDEYNKVIFFHFVLYYIDNRLWELNL